MLESFDEWFAVRDGHDDNKIWPGRLSFSSKNGVILKAITFTEDGDFFQAPDCDTGTITGYLDYQQPTTIVKPWVQRRYGARIGANTPVFRAKVRLVGSAILKNVHLTDVNENCFTGVSMNLPAFSSWYALRIVKTNSGFPSVKGLPNISVDVDKPEQSEFVLNDQTKVIIDIYTHTATEGSATSIAQQTSL